MAKNIIGYEHQEYDTPIKRFSQISDWVFDILKDTFHKQQQVYIEGYSFGSKGQGIFQIAENCGILKYRLQENKIPYDKLKNYIEDNTDTFERVYKFSDILNGNYDVIKPYNFDFEPYDLISKINSENISKIEAILNDWISHEGNYDDYNLDLISKIEKYDNEEIIINDIVRAYTETEIDEYFSDLYDSIINALNQYGEIISIDDGIVKINVDFQKLLELNPYSEYWMIEEIIEECKNDIYCVFQKLRNSDFEFPKLNLDYRWELPEPDEDNFNDRLNELL